MQITVLPGDGIGPEVTAEAIRVVAAICKAGSIDFDYSIETIGGSALRGLGDALPEITVSRCLKSDAVLLGAVGDPEFDKNPRERRPEAGLLMLRSALGGFANLRPATAIAALADSSPLRPEVFAGTDLLIVRELLGGLYFGWPRGCKADEAFNTMRYRRSEIERCARIAFQAARIRKKRLTSVDKANVLEVSQLWREAVSRLGEEEFPDVTVEHMYVDTCAMHLVTTPSRFDVILTENLFGDILSDEAAVLTGSLGMLASATIGGKVGLFEPVHGSAPEIAGKGVANPIGAIASAAMMFRYAFKNVAAAVAIEDAIADALSDGLRTTDIAAGGESVCTETMGREIADRAAARFLASRGNAASL